MGLSVGTHPCATIFSASCLFAWFILQIVIDGNGIEFKSASEGLKLMITGLLDHFT